MEVQRSVVRSATQEELPNLPAIHAASREVFRGTRHADVLNRPTLPLSYFAAANESGLLWVIPDQDNRPIGFAVGELLEGGGIYGSQISILPGHQRGGVGRDVIKHLLDWASQSQPFVALITFPDIPWNLPFYASMGFAPVPRLAVSTTLQACLDEDAAHGFDPKGRVLMIKGFEIDRQLDLTSSVNHRLTPEGPASPGPASVALGS